MESQEIRRNGWKHGKRKRYYLDGSLAEEDEFIDKDISIRGYLIEILNSFKEISTKKFIFNFDQDSNSKKIVKYIEKRKSKSKIIPVYENSKLGTIGPLSLISKNITGPILVMNGDLLTNISLEAMISFHLNGMFSSTIASVTYESNIPCGVLNSNQMGYLKSIDEKPTINYAVAGGVYILNKEVYDLLEYNKHYNMPDLLNDAVKKNYTNSLFPIHEKWKDIGSPDDYYEK